ncbi:MAG: MaoC family dehydratase [Burkholderiales bacterium]|nr:MaoC family dehydratase [Burkholderiales bacterium]MDE2274862.1 MaoC family dehydratase [Burkholderiales bacterium]
MKHYPHLAGLQALVGLEIGTSQWLVVEQSRIDRFAEATGDHQWIHVDPVRAAQGPFGATVAHGFLTLSLLPQLFETAFAVDDVRMGINYGLNRVRFPHPVRVGSRLRGRFRLLAYEPLEGGAQITVEATIEIEGAAKPACVAESVSRRYV